MAGSGERVMRRVPTWRVMANEQQRWSLSSSESIHSKNTLIMDAENERHPPALSLLLSELTDQNNDAISKTLGATSAGSSVKTMQQNFHFQTTSEGLTDASPDSLSKSCSSSANFSKTMLMPTENLASLHDSKPLFSSKVSCQYASDRSAFQGHGVVDDDKEFLSKTSCNAEFTNSALHEQGHLEVLPTGQNSSSVSQQMPPFKCGEESVCSMRDRIRTTEHLELQQNLERASYIGFQTGRGCLIKASATSMAKAKLLLEGNLDRSTVTESAINYDAELGSFVKSDQKLSQEDSGKENVPYEMKFEGVDMKHSLGGSLHDSHMQMQMGSIYNKKCEEQFCIASLNANLKGETTMKSSQLKSITEEGPTSLFQTGSGKSVPVSSAAMKRARALLGEDTDSEPLSHPKHARFTSSFRKPRTLLQPQAPKNYVVPGSKSASAFFNKCLPSSLQVASRSNIAREEAVSFETNNTRNSIPGKKTDADLPRSRLSGMRTDSETAQFTSGIFLPVQECLFQTALGCPVPISASAMDRARHLLLENSETLHSPSTITDIRTSNVGDFHNERVHFTSKQAKEFKDLPDIEDKAQISSRRISLTNMNNTSISSVQVPVSDFQKYKSCYTPSHSPLGAKRRSGSGKTFTLAFKHPRRRFSSPISNVSPDLNAQLPEVKIQVQLPISNLEDGKQSSCHSSLEVAPIKQISAESPSCPSSQFFESAAPMQMKLHSPHCTPTWEQSKGPHSKEVLLMTADSAKQYRLDCPMTVQKSGRAGPQEMRRLLLEAGLDKRNVTTEWVENHFRWIVWKLACQERRHGHQAAAKLLTFQRVLRELKHRYHREVNQGHRSALKKITEGDASAAQTMILCISAIRSIDTEIKKKESSVQLRTRIMIEDKACKSARNMSVPPAKIEVTDGWYSLNVVLDPLLTEQLRLGRLFVGQKVRVCGATLIGCLEPLPPLEAFNLATLVVHINGFNRAYSSERLGFCRQIPLAFRCIKGGGGIVLATYVGIRRVYPMLFRERLSDGHSVVRSSRAEDLARTRFEERQAYAIEDSLLKLQKGNLSKFYMSDEESDEGAQLNKALDIAGDPEMFMAEMTSAQHIALAIFQEKREAAKRVLIEKHVRKSLDEAELVSRHVTAFMKIRVEGVRSIGASGAIEATGPWKAESGKTREGVITIWEANTDEVSEIVEGGLYCVTNLISTSEKYAGGSDDVLYLSTTKSTRWRRLFGQASNTFQFSFCPRPPVMLSTLGEITIGVEFDVAVTVLHVGEAFICGVRKLQWLFTADGTLDIGMSNGSCQQHAILAIKFSWPLEASFPMDRSMTGSVVGFHSLIKGTRDCKNNFWVAQSTELSCFSSKLTSKSFSHLKEAINSVKLWAASSKPVLTSLCQRVQKVTGSVSQ